MNTVLTKEQALKKNRRTLLIGELIGIVFFAVGMLLGESGGIMVIPSFGFILITPFIFLSTKKRIKRTYCLHCGKKYDYEADVAWEVTNVTTKENSQDALIIFECTCSQCNQTRNFSKNFRIASYNNNTQSWTKHNVKNLAKLYFR